MPQPLAGVLRNLAFAKQRFDSKAGPVGKMALILLPAATLLACIASDGGCEKEQREPFPEGPPGALIGYRAGDLPGNPGRASGLVS